MYLYIVLFLLLNRNQYLNINKKIFLIILVSIFYYLTKYRETFWGSNFKSSIGVITSIHRDIEYNLPKQCYKRPLDKCYVGGDDICRPDGNSCRDYKHYANTISHVVRDNIKKKCYDKIEQVSKDDFENGKELYLDILSASLDDKLDDDCNRIYDLTPKIYTNNRIEFNPPLPLNYKNECPKDYSLSIEQYKEYCTDDDNNENKCRLDIDGNDQYPICNTVTCPSGYEFSDQLCINKVNKNDKCSLDVRDNRGYKLCNGHNNFIPFKDIDVEDYTLKSIPNTTAKLCSMECYKNRLCDGFTIDANKTNVICKLKKKPRVISAIKKNTNKITYFRNSVNYTPHMNLNTNGEEIKTYDINTPTECAKICDEDINCNSFQINKTNLECKLKKPGNTVIVDNDNILFKKKYYHGNLCDKLSNNKVNEDIKTYLDELDVDNNLVTQQLDEEYNLQLDKLTKTSKKRAMGDVMKIYANNIDTIYWNNIYSDCNNIIIKNNNNKMNIAYIQIVGYDSQSKYTFTNLLQKKGIIITTDSDKYINNN